MEGNGRTDYSGEVDEGEGGGDGRSFGDGEGGIVGGKDDVHGGVGQGVEEERRCGYLVYHCVSRCRATIRTNGLTIWNHQGKRSGMSSMISP